MKKRKIIIIIILTVLILFGIYMLYNSFAINSYVSSDNDTYTIVLTEDNNTITVAANSNKTVFYHIKNTNNGDIRYEVGYTSDNVIVKVYKDSIDPKSGIIGQGENKFVKLYLSNVSDSDATVNLKAILGYVNGGELILSDNTSFITDEYDPDNNVKESISLVNYINNLYTDAEKSTVVNNEITYNYATEVNLMNDRLGGSTDSLDGGNIRYYGSSPNNYIYFNCEKYPDTNCELWRIIGIFDGKIKIMRNESIGAYSWDTTSKAGSILSYTGTSINEWSQADIMKLLNPGHESESVGGSLYYNSKSGTCYNGAKNATTACDFTSSGIKNEITRNVIADGMWTLGGMTGDITAEAFSEVFYATERGTGTVAGSSDNVTRTTSWVGKIALIYPSDYGYATDFNKCTLKLISYNDSNDSYACRSNDWMFLMLNADSKSWLLTPSASLSFVSHYINNDGQVTYSRSNGKGYQPFDIFPSLFLDSSLIMVDGTIGTIDNPYKLDL